MLYPSERDFISHINNFSEAIALIKIDKILCDKGENGKSIITLINYSNLFPYKIVLDEKEMKTFSLLLCCELICRDSKSIAGLSLPDPLNNVGDVAI